jgi:hypothetical protein
MGTLLVTLFQILVILILITFVVMISMASDGRFDKWEERHEKKGKGKQLTD